jgi:hypothetical protein
MRNLVHSVTIISNLFYIFQMLKSIENVIVLCFMFSMAEMDIVTGNPMLISNIIRLLMNRLLDLLLKLLNFSQLVFKNKIPL